MNKITAFVPARSGSKRLPGKNIRPLAGKPLVLWTLEACMGADSVDEVIFSTDSQEYWELAQNHFGKDGRLVLDDRSGEEAGDKVKIFDYLVGAADKVFGERTGDFLMALPTMPLRDSADVNAAVRASRESKQGVFSCVEYDFAISFAFSESTDGDWVPVFDNSPMVTGNTRSQDQALAYHPNGAIYIQPIDLLKSGALKTIYDGAKPFIMERSKSVDIDTIGDFRIAEAMLKFS